MELFPSIQYDKLELYIKGSCQQNPGPMAIGWMVVDGETVLEERAEKIEDGTNNLAESKAAVAGLEAVVKYAPKRVEVFTNSENFARQMAGQIRTKDPKLVPLQARMFELHGNFPEGVSYTHIWKEHKRTMHLKGKTRAVLGIK